MPRRMTSSLLDSELDPSAAVSAIQLMPRGATDMLPTRARLEHDSSDLRQRRKGEKYLSTILVNGMSDL